MVPTELASFVTLRILLQKHYSKEVSLGFSGARRSHTDHVKTPWDGVWDPRSVARTGVSPDEFLKTIFWFSTRSSHCGALCGPCNPITILFIP